jgi:hypothetical protein
MIVPFMVKVNTSAEFDHLGYGLVETGRITQAGIVIEMLSQVQRVQLLSVRDAKQTV